MTKRFRLSWLNLGLLAGVLGMTVAACTRVESDDDGGGGGGNNTQNGNGGAGQTTNSTASGLTSGTTKATGTTTTTTTKAAGGATSTGATAARGGTSSTTKTTATGNVPGCEGVPAPAPDPDQQAAACNGMTIEAEPLPVDMVILMDRSISNSYAIGSETAAPAGAGQLTRWNVLTNAMSALATSPEAQNLGASITFFSFHGGSQATGTNSECNASDYATPVVPLGLLSDTGPKIIAAMTALKPSGLTPTVPALTGAFQYAMAAKQADPTREKVVVLISDGFPTICPQKAPSDVANVINEAATAPVPIRTFIIGIGSPNSLDAAKFNLQNYAVAGHTGKPPFVIDELAGADAVQNQLVTILLNISSSSLACEYGVAPPTPDWVIDPNQVMFTYRPNIGALQEIPKVSGASTCSVSPNGGWYFDNPVTPTKITVCPCTCTNFGAGAASVIYGCKPNIEYI